MILIYRVLTTLLYPIIISITYLRKILRKEDSLRFKEKIFTSHFKVSRKNNTKLIWFHAASIGEFKSVIPIIDELNKQDHELEFLITTITLSSGNLATTELKKYENVYHRFFPIDVGFIIDNFLESWKPNAIFLVDSEIWPNLILKASQKKIPVAIINARITNKSFKRWMYFINSAKKIFSLLNFCLTSNLETKEYLLKLGAKNISYIGNIKIANKIDKNKISNSKIKILANRRFWVGASTHENEEELCLQTHLKLKKHYKDIITVIAPRHINRVSNVKKLCKNFNLEFQVFSLENEISTKKEIVIVNSFGILQDFFEHAKSVFIGKSLVKKLKNVGGQNPIEATKLNCKVYHGPYTYNFDEVYKFLEENGVSKVINGSDDLTNYLLKDLENPKKIDHKISILVNNFGEKILFDTMKKINNFLFDEIN